MNKKLLIVFFFLTTFFAKAQCPQVFDYLGTLSNKPYWINCSGTGTYAMNFQSNTGWGTYTISWGDGSPNQSAASYVANSLIPHTYTTAATDTFIVTLMIPSLTCTMTGIVVMEKPVIANIQVPIGGAKGCEPATIQFTNSSTNVSASTTFTWNFGDGSPPAIFSYTNAGQTISHIFNVGSVNCQTIVTLQAQNYCSMGSPTIDNNDTVKIYKKDAASISPSAFIQCWPNSTFTFTNSSVGNCVAQGNSFPRKEEWHFGDYWGKGYDSIIPWSPWPPTTPRTISYLAVGTYSVLLRDSNFCGISTSLLNVSIIAAPVAGMLVQPSPLCVNSPISFTNTGTPGYFYKWDFGVGAGFVSTSYAPQVYTYTTAGTYTVKTVVYFGSGCSDTAKTVITILPKPVANFSFTPAYGCNTLSGVTFTDASISAASWNWTFGNGNTSTSPTPASQNYTTTGNYVITLTVFAASGCTNTKTASITVYQKPTAAFIPTTTCIGAGTTFTDLSTSAATNTIISWTWNFADGSPTSGVQNPIHTFTASGSYSVTLVVNSAFCKDSIKKNVLVTPRPNAAFTVTPFSGCPTLTCSFSNGTSGAVSYLWNFGTVPTTTSVAFSPTRTFTNSSGSTVTYTVTLIAFNAFGCNDTAQQTINVFPKPSASFTTNAITGCTPFAITFTNTSVGATTNNWNFGDGNTSLATSPAHTYTNSTSVTQTLTAQLITFNASGCSDTATQVILVYPKPSFTISSVPATGCSPLVVNFSAASGVTSANWNFGDGNTSVALSPAHTFTNTLLSTVNFTVTLIASDGFGCVDTAYDFIQVLAKPIADFNRNPTSGCGPLKVTFTNTSTLSAAYNWDFKDGNLATSPNPVHTFTTNNALSNTVFNVELVVISSNGCRDTIRKTVTLLPMPDANFSVDTPACSPKILTFTNTSVGGNTYAWNFGNSNTSTATNPTQQYINNFSFNQSFTVQLVTTNTASCTDTLKVPIIIHPQPNFSFVATPTAGCAPLKVNFPNVPGATVYNWNFGDGNTATSGGISHTYSNLTGSDITFTVQLIASDLYGCADTVKSQVTAFAQPIANFQVAATTINIPTNQLICTNLSTGNVSNYWTFGNGGSSTAVNPTYNYTLEGDFVVTLIVTSIKGCKDTFSLAEKIIVREETNIQVPNAFTPNTQGSPGTIFNPTDLNNDIFHPVLKGIDKSTYELSIYSRWGELLFHTKETTEGWDGYYKGKLCTQDVYVWKIKASSQEGTQINKTGDLLLLK